MKLYSRIIERRLRKEIEHKLEDEQAAYRSNRQTQDHIYTIRTMMENALAHGKELCIAFIDLEAAFDSLNREKIWKILRKMKVTQKLRKVIINLYKNVEGKVRLNGKCSQIFKMRRGVKQGDSLSPLLFIVVMNEILKNCKNKIKNIDPIGYWNLIPVSVHSLVFVDDIALLAKTKINYRKWSTSGQKSCRRTV